MEENWQQILQLAKNRIEETRSNLEHLSQELGIDLLNSQNTNEEDDQKNSKVETKIETTDIYLALAEISLPLAHSYAQVKQDIADEGRISWRGTANEIRETLREILDTLAPDSEVKSQKWYQQLEKSGPTRKQKIKYIMEKHGAGSTEREVVEKAEKELESSIEAVINAGYARASDATHRSKSRIEIKRILKYFDAFAHDLLNLN